MTQQLRGLFDLGEDLSSLTEFRRRMIIFHLLGYMLYPENVREGVDRSAARRNQLMVFHIARELERAAAEKIPLKLKLEAYRKLLTIFFTFGGFKTLRQARSVAFLNKRKLKKLWKHWLFTYTTIDLNCRWVKSQSGDTKPLSINKSIWAATCLNDDRPYRLTGDRDDLEDKARRTASVGHLIVSALWLVGTEKAPTLTKLRDSLLANFEAFIGGALDAQPIAAAYLQTYRTRPAEIFELGASTWITGALVPQSPSLPVTENEKWILALYDSATHKDARPKNFKSVRHAAAKKKKGMPTEPPVETVESRQNKQRKLG